MIEDPSVEVRILPHPRLCVEGPLAARVHAFSRAWSTAHGKSDPPACQIQVIQAPPQHQGFGTGTQLGLCIAAGLNALYELPFEDTPALAQAVGRGKRSSVGSHGFAHGGLIFEPGQLPGETLAPLERQVDPPTAWQVVLVCQQDHPGLNGISETRAFSAVPPIPAAQTAAMLNEARETILPAAESGDFEQFSESIYRFGLLAGNCFAEVQGGVFADPSIARRVRHLRQLGIAGVGQSSWGPTVFAFTPSPAAAQRLVNQLRQDFRDESVTVRSTAINRGGVSMQIGPYHPPRPRGQSTRSSGS